MNDTRRILLDALAAGPVSRPDLADRLGISRAAAWKHVEALRDEGFGVESAGDGYVVTDVPEYGAPAIGYDPDVGYDVESHETLDSSNDRACDLAAEGMSDVVVVTREQTASRGRKNWEWSASDGGVWLSLFVRPDESPAYTPLYMLTVVVAVRGTTREAGVGAKVKWPNDVIVSEASGSSLAHAGDRPTDADAPDDRSYRELCGILTEMGGEADRVSWLVIGSGINVNLGPAELPEVATSVAAEAGPVECHVFVQRALERFDTLRSDLNTVLPVWRERVDTLGRRVHAHTVSGVIESDAVDIEHPDTLVVSTDVGGKRAHAGDYKHLRPAGDGR